MNFKNNFLKKIILIIFLLFSFTSITNASTTSGTINPSNYIAKFLDEGSSINFGYFLNNPTKNVTVTDSELTGYIWGQNVGWINLNCSNNNSCASQSFKVSNDGYGNLSGYAWGENTGWVNFKSTSGNASHVVTLIPSTDSTYTTKFSGYAFSENYGWIQFDCAVANACVQTDWKSISEREEKKYSQTCKDQTATNYGGSSSCKYASKCLDQTALNYNSVGQCTYQPQTCQDQTATNYGGSLPCKYDAKICTGPDCVQPQDDEVKNPPDDELKKLPDDDKVVKTPVDDFIKKLTNPPLWTGFAKKSIDILKTPAGDNIAKVVTAVGIAVGAVASITATLFINPLSFSELFLLPLRLWSLLLVAFGLKKRNRPWGTVYDSVTKQPLDPAYVVLKDEYGKEVASSITDLDGRYAFFVKPGIYTIIASKTNHIFPSKNLLGQERDEIYSDLYFGEKIIIENEESVIRKNIPMDPVGFDWNEFAKKDKNLLRFYSANDVSAARLAKILFIVGFIIAGTALLSAPKPYNIIIFVLYILLLVLREFGLKPPSLGMVTEKETGYPLSFAVVRIFSASTNTEVSKRITDEHGRYHCLMSQGSYYVSIEKKNADQSYIKVFTSEPFETKKGLINETFNI